MDVSRGTVDTLAREDDDPQPAEILDRLEGMQRRVMSHPVYEAVDQDSLPCFMEHHVFAVLDFMWLLKSLQSSLTNTEVAWTPVGDPTARRLVNEIVLGEESDTVAGRHVSHFDLYVQAMREAGADTGPILECVGAIREGMAVPRALEACDGPRAAVEFSLQTWEVASGGGLHERVAAFAFGREEIIPEMFVKLLDDRESSRDYPMFRMYLERHVEVDGDLHGPLALELVRNTCGGDPERWRRAEDAAGSALRNRAQLWDAVFETIAGPGALSVN